MSNWNTIRITEGTQTDADKIAELSKQAIEKGLGWRWDSRKVLKAIKNPRTIVLVAKIRSEFVGFGIMDYYQKKANLNLLAVSKYFRNRGIGSELVIELEEIAKRNGIENIYVQVREKNVRAQEFYEKLGYGIIDITRKYYNGKENAVIMYNYIPVETQVLQ